MQKILLTNGENLKTLTTLRNLAKHNYEVHVSSDKWYACSFYSRYCKGKLRTINQSIDKEKFLQDHFDYIIKNKIDIFIPINPPELAIVLENRKKFEDLKKQGINVKIPFDSFEKFDKARDKYDFYLICKKAKVNVPKTLLALEKKLDFNFPVVLKERKGAGSERLKIAKNKNELEKYYKEFEEKNILNKYIVQEFVYGQNYGSASFSIKGESKIIFNYISVREFHVNYGTSTSRKSIYDKTIENDVKKILKVLKWNYIGHFDIIKTKSGENYFIEMNPRLWLSISLPIYCGLDFPYYLVDEKATIPKNYKENITARVLFSDILVFIKSNFKYFLNKKQYEKYKYPMKEFLQKSYFDDLDIKDLMPSLFLFFLALKGREI
ncbi:MAG: ATP-grasp domain-containing protein [Candidatus Woesearchaeota archaeon]